VSTGRLHTVRPRGALAVTLAVALVVSLSACGRADPVLEAATAGGTGGAGGAGPPGAGASVATQVAARVNGREITVHQVNDRMAVLPRGMGDDQAARRALDHLVDMTVVGQVAEAQGLDKDPQVLRQLQAARQEVLARAWVQQISQDDPQPGAEEVRRYYDEHPDWFSRHRVFMVQELRATVPADQRAAVQAQMMSLPTPSAQTMSQWLERQGYAPTVSSGMRSSAQLPPTVLSALSAHRVGHAVSVPDDGGVSVWWVQAVHEQPIGWTQARPAIERQLGSQRRTERTRQEIRRLREQARIDYEGDFVPPTPDPASSPSPR